MSLYRRNTVWWVRFTTPGGERVRRSAGTTNKEEAQEYHDRLKAEIWKIQQLGRKPRRTWEQAAVRWLKEKAHKASLDADRMHLRWLDGHLRGMNLETMTREVLDRLIEAIVGMGGPGYEFSQIDPGNNKDGGQPGGNIRVGFLFDPARVKFSRRGFAGALDATTVTRDSTGLRLTLNPGRIYPEERSFRRSRKPLVAEFEFKGQRLFIINNHLNSKGGDDRLFGANQPPEFRSERKRKEQALAVQAFVFEILSRDPHANVIVLGDLNEHEFHAPVHLIAGPFLTNLIATLPQEERYTYIFTGNSQILDHILISRNLMQKASPEVDIVHINAEFSRGQRASDHDAVVVRFQFE